MWHSELGGHSWEPTLLTSHPKKLLEKQDPGVKKRRGIDTNKSLEVGGIINLCIRVFKR
jgi:hypothetical protein